MSCPIGAQLFLAVCFEGRVRREGQKEAMDSASSLLIYKVHAGPARADHKEAGCGGWEVKCRAQSPSCKPPPLNLVNSVCADCPALGNPELPGALLATERLGFFFWSVFYLSYLEFTHYLRIVNIPHNVRGLWERGMCISYRGISIKTSGSGIKTT